MGAGASTTSALPPAAAFLSELEKPADSSDVRSLEAARGEVARLRSLLASVRSEPGTMISLAVELLAKEVSGEEVSADGTSQLASAMNAAVRRVLLSGELPADPTAALAAALKERAAGGGGGSVKLLLVGSGAIAAAIASAASARDDVQLRVLVRAGTDAAKKEVLAKLGAELVEGDLADAGSLAAACAGQDVVISAVSGKAIPEQAALVHAAAAAGVRRFVPSQFGVDAGAVAASGSSCALAEAQAAIAALVRASGMDWTLFNAGCASDIWVTGLGNVIAPGSAPPAEVTVYGDGKGPFAFLSLRDIGRATLALALDGRAKNAVVGCVAQTTTQAALLDAWERLSGKTVARHSCSAEALDAAITSMAGADQLLPRGLHELYRAVLVQGLTSELREGVLDLATLYPDWSFEAAEAVLRRSLE
eukprot:PLAT7390.1.p2 GENE.PLAT7390.1~~PLAT7390.1.p2  ORF type:complete len:422 (+),score=230.04 PLAT7390.1:102-1367(+)